MYQQRDYRWKIFSGKKKGKNFFSYIDKQRDKAGHHFPVINFYNESRVGGKGNPQKHIQSLHLDLLTSLLSFLWKILTAVEYGR